MSATTQQFFLRWNNYVNHLTYAFDSLRTQEDLVDVTLSCEGRKIRAHKVILSACSTYFREVFQENPCQHPVIVFKNVRYEDLTAIIEFIYQGEVNVVQESLPSFLHTAELLSVQGLTEGAAAEKEEREMPVSKPFAAAAKVQTPIATRSGSSREVARLPPKSTTLTTVTTEAPAPKRKRFYIDSDDNIAIEGLNFVKQSPDTITIENANVEFTPMKIDIPDYIDISTGADEESAGGGVAEEVLMEDRGDDTAIEDDGGESQEDQDLTETDTTPQILAVRSGSEDVEQTYRVEAVDSSDISTDFNQSKYSGEGQGKGGGEKSLQQDAKLRFRCSICWKGFKHPMSLTLHRDLHSGKTKCPVCKRSFSRSYDMRTHMNKIHKITLNFDAKLNIAKF